MHLSRAALHTITRARVYTYVLSVWLYAIRVYSTAVDMLVCRTVAKMDKNAWSSGGIVCRTARLRRSKTRSAGISRVASFLAVLHGKMGLG